MVTNQEQRNKIQEFIQTELLKRGFLAPITKFEEVEGRHGSTRIEFETENFQTTPVLFKDIKVANFSSSIGKEETNEHGKTFRLVWISVHVSYNHFDGGSNGSKLFDIYGKLHEGDVYGLEVR